MNHPTNPFTADQQAEEDLVRAAMRDPAAFDALYQHFVKPVYRYLYSRVGCQAEAEEVTSLTFLSALEAFPRYRHDGHFAAWLFSIARRKAADFYRSNQNAQFLPDEIPSAEMDLLTQTIHAERLSQLGSMIPTLSEEEQELLRLRFAAQLGFAEIARLLGRQEDAVKKSLYRLLDRLQSRLEDSHE